jgi:hypothetical protein
VQSAARDQQVLDAWTSRRLDDGTRLNLGRTDREQAFIVRETGSIRYECRLEPRLVQMARYVLAAG